MAHKNKTVKIQGLSFKLPKVAYSETIAHAELDKVRQILIAANRIAKNANIQSTTDYLLLDTVGYLKPLTSDYYWRLFQIIE